MHHYHLSMTGISCLKFLLQVMIKATGQLSFFMVHVCDQTVAG